MIANTFNLSQNFGKLLENQVYLSLRRQRKKIFYYQTSEGYEIDFVTQDENGNHEMLQVVWDKSDPHTIERENRALSQAQIELGFSGRLVTWDKFFKRFFALKFSRIGGFILGV